jgi:hypothetical protein
MANEDWSHVPRTPLNRWWCAHHWAPYVARGDEALGQRACAALTRTTTLTPLFQTEYGKLMREKNAPSSNALANAAIEKLYERHKKAMCCIMGDANMEIIRQRTTR